MLFTFKITIPANTTQATPSENTEKLLPGKITNISFQIPAGHRGLAHLQILDQEVQIYPFNNGGDLKGDDLFLQTGENYILNHPSELLFRGWNTDELHDHSFFVWITLLPTDRKGEIQDIDRGKILELQQANLTFLERLNLWLKGDLE